MIKKDVRDMYCEKHKRIIRCNSFQRSTCEVCGDEFVSANAPPINKVCKQCSEKKLRCEYCGCSVK